MPLDDFDRPGPRGHDPNVAVGNREDTVAVDRSPACHVQEQLDIWPLNLVVRVLREVVGLFLPCFVEGRIASETF